MKPSHHAYQHLGKEVPISVVDCQSVPVTCSDQPDPVFSGFEFFYDKFPFSLRLQIQLSTLRPLLYSQLKIHSFFIQYILITVSSPSSPLFKSKTKCSKLGVVCEGVAGGEGCV